MQVQRASTLDSHYTPKIVIDSIYKSLKHFGLDNYNETKEILEPSAGNGAFISYAKNHLIILILQLLKQIEFQKNYLKIYIQINQLQKKGFEEFNSRQSLMQ